MEEHIQSSQPDERETNLDESMDIAKDGVSKKAVGSASSTEIDLRKIPGTSSEGPAKPVFEEWFHGKLPRKQVQQNHNIVANIWDG